MTPEEYERFKSEEKAHLRKLKALKRAVHELERKKKIQSTLQDMSRQSAEALDAQEEAVERLARETALREARLDVALDSGSAEKSDEPDGELPDDELRAVRARQLVEEIRSSMDGPARSNDAGRSRAQAPSGGAHTTSKPSSGGRSTSANPTEDRADRPEKTIGRM